MSLRDRFYDIFGFYVEKVIGNIDSIYKYVGSAVDFSVFQMSRHAVASSA